jgi:hypothetical protein
MGTNNAVFLEILEWFDDTGKELVHRIPEEGSAEIKFGAQMTVREFSIKARHSRLLVREGTHSKQPISPS